MNSPASTSSNRTVSKSQLAQRIGTGVAVVVLLVAAYEGTHLLFDVAPSSTADESVDDAPDRVNLSPEKITRGDIATIALEPRLMQKLDTAPATLNYNANQHVELRAALDCVVKELKVGSGEAVSAGDTLLILSSAEMGARRNLLSKGIDDLHLAEMQHDWAETTHKSLDELLGFLSSRPELATVEQQFQGRTLGKHRKELLASYSEYLLATKNLERTERGNSSQILSERTIDQRRSELEIASASFTSAFEETQFESARELAVVKADRDAARREVEACREKVQVLLGDFGQLVETQRQSEFALTSPIAGNVVQLFAKPSARFQPGEQIMQIADTRTLWVTAHLSQDTAARLEVQPSESLWVEFPGIHERPLPAIYQFLGAEVSPVTLSIPLVAEIENVGDQLRPGMSAWVHLPVSAPQKLLAVPASALQIHEGKSYVFVQESPTEFRRVEVMVGMQSEGWAEIIGDLNSGDRIVHRGAFYVESELLLESED